MRENTKETLKNSQFPKGDENTIDYKAERRLKKINKVVFIISLISALLVLNEGINAILDYDNPVLYIVGAIGIIVSALLIWAFNAVILNISINLHKLNSKSEEV